MIIHSNFKTFARGKIGKVIALSCTLYFCGSAYADFIPVGPGGYTTDLPAGRKAPSNTSNAAAMPKLAPGFNKPVKTSQWWSSLIWAYNTGNPWSENLIALPLSFKAKAVGMEVGYPTNHYVTGYNPVAPDQHKVQEYHYPHASDMTLSVVGLSAGSTQVKDYSDWAVTAYWNGNGRTLQTTIGSGLPFVYTTLSGGDALIQTNAPPAVWYNGGGVLGVTINGHNYGIFAPSGSTWTIQGNNLQSSLSGKNYYSVAILPDNQQSTLEFFRKHAYAFVTNTQVAWDYDETSSAVAATYTATTTLMEAGPGNTNVNRPLMALLRHQWLHSSDPFVGFSYSSSHGEMKVVDASKFTTMTQFSGVLPRIPNIAVEGVDGYSQAQLYGYVDAIYKQSVNDRWTGTNAGTDTYWMGKALAKVAHLIPIADQVKHTAARDLFIGEVKVRLQNWFSGKTAQLFYYDRNWDTLIGYPASYGSDIQLSDHHFHYGYYIMAASIVAQYDQAWAQASQWGGMVEMLIRDVTNWDRSDARFPFLRFFDIYAGHSWASGTAQFGSGNNEESSSEAIDYSSALVLWGALLKNDAIRDLGIYLYTTAVSAIPQYWFDVDNVVFPGDFAPNTLGMVWSDGGAYALWFEAPVKGLHGINFLPIQPGMLYLGQYPDYLKANQDFMMGNQGNVNPGFWRDIHMSVKSLYDPKAAIAEFNANAGYGPEEGETKAHTYHWIHNINQLGRVDTTVTANVPTYAVFAKDGIKSYVAYNPTSTASTVKFSNGVTLAVPAYTLATSKGTPPPPPPPPSPHEFTEGETEAGIVTLWFKPNWDTQYVKVTYKINSGAEVTANMSEVADMWQYSITGLAAGSVIDYYYTYEDNGAAVKSGMNQHIYRGTCPVPSEDPVDDTENFTIKLVPNDTGFKAVFIAKKNTSFVDLHYRGATGPLINVRMQNTNGTWTYDVDKFKVGDVVTYSFTYDVDFAGRDTKNYTHTVKTPTPSK